MIMLSGEKYVKRLVREKHRSAKNELEWKSPKRFYGKLYIKSGEEMQDLI